MTGKLVEKLHVIATSAVTWLSAIMVIITAVVERTDIILPGTVAPVVTTWLLRILGWLTIATLIIRRVTPVAEDERGILPPDENAGGSKENPPPVGETNV